MNSKHVLYYESGDGIHIIHEIPGEAGWPEMFGLFRNFLNAIGFSVPPGEWVEEDDLELDRIERGEGRSDNLHIEWDNEEDLRGPMDGVDWDKEEGLYGKENSD